MKDCAFSISLESYGGNFSDAAGRAITGAGGEFDGDNENGSFRLATGIGKVEGTYRIGDEALHVTITSKPVLISCGRIEKEIRKYLSRH